MNTETKFAAALLPGDTYKDGRVTAISGPYQSPAGRMVRITTRTMVFGRPVFETFDVLSLTIVSQ